MQQLLALDKEQQSRLLNEMLKDLLSPPIQKALKKLNEGNAGWAVVRLANG
jgi:hypothetical protein